MRSFGLAVVALLAGCSVYIPQPLDTPPPAGTQVRAKLTTPGSVRVSRLFGLPVQELEGQILNMDRDSLGLSLLSATEYGRPWDSVDTLMVARGEILQLDEKRVDGKKTAFLVGGVGVVSGIVIGALFRAASSSKDGKPPGEIDQILIPLFSFRH
ncbi:MAG: hypothetical protein ABIF09_06230 [Gemmatimonadota bacterium]